MNSPKIDLNKKYLEFVSKKIGINDKSINKQIVDEINSNCNMKGIYNNKGFFAWVGSLFSSGKALSNIIEIFLVKLSSRMQYIIKLVKSFSLEYLDDLNKEMMLKKSAATLEFNEEQKKRWTILCESYRKTKEIILNIKKFS